MQMLLELLGDLAVGRTLPGWDHGLAQQLAQDGLGILAGVGARSVRTS
jgi:hypothetical protein